MDQGLMAWNLQTLLSLVFFGEPSSITRAQQGLRWQGVGGATHIPHGQDARKPLSWGNSLWSQS